MSRPDPLDGVAETLDSAALAFLAQMAFGLSPATIAQAFSDWGLHLTLSPGKRLQLGAKVACKHARLFGYLLRSAGDADAELEIAPLPQDRRFSDPAWKQPPFNAISQAFLLNQQWWHAATTGICRELAIAPSSYYEHVAPLGRFLPVIPKYRADCRSRRYANPPNQRMNLSAWSGPRPIRS